MDKKPSYEELELRVKKLESDLRASKKAEAILGEAQAIKQLLNFAPFGVYLIDVSGKIIACNENGAERLGKTSEAAIGTALREYFPADVSENRRCKGIEAFQSRQGISFEDQAGGRWYRNSIFPIFDEKRRPEKLAIYGADVTEYKNALEALKNSEWKYRQLAELLPQVVFETDEKGNLTFTNHMAFDLFGYSTGDLRSGLTALQMLIPEDRDRALANMQRALRGEQMGGTEYTALTKTGRRYPVMVYSNPIVGEGKAIGLRGIIVDLTEMKQVQEALRESEERYRTLLDSIEEIYFEVDLAGNLTFFNDALSKSLGYSNDELMGMENRDFMSPEYAKNIYSLFDRIYRTGHPIKGVVYEVIRKDGSRRFHELFAALLKNQSGESVGFRGIAHDVTERKQAEEKLRESEERYRILVEESPLGVSLIGKGGRYRYLNRKFVEMFGYTLEEIPTGKEWFRKAYPDEKYRKEVLKTWIDDHQRYGIGGARPRSYQVTCKDKSRKVIHFRPVTMESGDQLVIYEDVTEAQRLEEQLRQAQKMEALGLMAGGVAHDLNNILSGIVSYPELILMDLPEDSPLRKPMQTIRESGLRAADVVADLLTIARGAAIGKETLNINAMVSEYLGSPEHRKLETTHTSVQFRTDLDSDLLNMRGSPIHLKKTLMNLVTNASEAIDGKGSVTIATFNRYLDKPLRGYEEVRTGEYVVLAVSDNGPGISPDDMERIFEPFYTKKVMGRSGTGLGLAVVWNTVQDHHAFINVESSNKGTRFEIYFPVTRGDIAEKMQPIDFKDFLGNGEMILVVDDEESQREIASGVLNKLGYKTEAVSSGEEAIEYVREHPVDLIVLDMVMPKGINGRETYEEIIKIRPGQKAVIASGYSKTEEVDAAQDLGAGKYIKKPYTLEKIGVAVKKELKKD